MSDKPEEVAGLGLDPLRTFSVAEAAAFFGQTELWYATQLRARKIPGHKIGRKWRLTEADILATLELFARPAIIPVPVPVPVPDPSGLTRLSRLRFEDSNRRGWRSNR